jgi:hypothetical protein
MILARPKAPSPLRSAGAVQNGHRVRLVSQQETLKR